MLQTRFIRQSKTPTLQFKVGASLSDPALYIIATEWLADEQEAEKKEEEEGKKKKKKIYYSSHHCCRKCSSLVTGTFPRCAQNL